MADQKIWARLDGDRVVELLSLDADLVPGTDVPEIWTHDVTSVVGLAVGWTLGADESFTAPAVDIAALKTAKLVEISSACEAAITGGFVSSALGSPHTYPSGRDDQQNLSAVAAASLLPGMPSNWTVPFSCCVDPLDLTTWARRPHTGTQIQQVGLDGLGSYLRALTKLDDRRAAVAAATTAADIAAVVWG